MKRLLAVSLMSLVPIVPAGGAFALSCPANTVCETYSYDLHGRLTQVYRVKKDGTTTTVTVAYDYDEAGNRIQKDTS